MDDHEEHGLEFSTLLASAAHDIKNSLGIFMSTLDIMSQSQNIIDTEDANYVSLLRAEAARVNNELVYLLGLYRLQNHQLNLHIDEVYLPEYLEDQHDRHEVMFAAKKIALEVSAADDLLWFFDGDLVAGILNNAIVNAVKYTRTKVTVNAFIEDDFLCIQIRDDGAGFPQAIIDQSVDYQRGIDFKSGSTNLGLFFSQQIAALHQTSRGRGRFELSNHPEGGGLFSVFLP